MRTYSAKAGEVEKKWYLVDAEGEVLGRLASQVAIILRGKHKPQFTPHMDTGDYSINDELGGADYQAALKQAVGNEQVMIRFYTDAEEHSRATLADIPVAFRRVIKKRNERLEKLQTMSGA